MENTLYDVETTSIIDTLQDFSPSLSSLAISSYLKDFIKEVEEEALKRNVLNGEYIVTLPPIPNFQTHKQWLLDQILSFVKSTKDSKEYKEINLGKVKNESIVISKISSLKNRIYEAIAYGVKIDQAAAQELAILIDKALMKKSKKLKELDNPIILLLLDSYLYSEISDWEKIIANITIPPIFDSIFRTSTHGPAELLFSKHFK